jgi:hypothetical protein
VLVLPSIEIRLGWLKLSLQQSVEAERVVRRRDSNIVHAIGSQMAVRWSALLAGRPLPLEDSWYSFLLETELIARPEEE